MFLLEWDDMLVCYILRWKEFYDVWLTFNKPMILLRYDDLKTNMERELHKISDFLHLNSTGKRVSHTLKHSEGQFHRKHSAYSYDKIYQGEKQKWVDYIVEYTNKNIAAKFDKNGFYAGSKNYVMDYLL